MPPTPGTLRPTVDVVRHEADDLDAAAD